MPAKSKRENGQKGRREREAKLPTDERSVLLNEYSQTRSAVANRAARPREEHQDAWRRKQRVQDRLTHHDAWLERGWQPEWTPSPGERRWRSLPSDVLTVAR